MASVTTTSPAVFLFAFLLASFSFPCHSRPIKDFEDSDLLHLRDVEGDYEIDLIDIISPIRSASFEGPSHSVSKRGVEGGKNEINHGADGNVAVVGMRDDAFGGEKSFKVFSIHGLRVRPKSSEPDVVVDEQTRPEISETNSEAPSIIKQILDQMTTTMATGSSTDEVLNPGVFNLSDDAVAMFTNSFYKIVSEAQSAIGHFRELLQCTVGMESIMATQNAFSGNATEATRQSRSFVGRRRRGMAVRLSFSSDDFIMRLPLENEASSNIALTLPLKIVTSEMADPCESEAKSKNEFVTNIQKLLVEMSDFVREVEDFSINPERVPSSPMSDLVYLKYPDMKLKVMQGEKSFLEFDSKERVAVLEPAKISVDVGQKKTSMFRILSETSMTQVRKMQRALDRSIKEIKIPPFDPSKLDDKRPPTTTTMTTTTPYSSTLSVETAASEMPTTPKPMASEMPTTVKPTANLVTSTTASEIPSTSKPTANHVTSTTASEIPSTSKPTANHVTSIVKVSQMIGIKEKLSNKNVATTMQPTTSVPSTSATPSSKPDSGRPMTSYVALYPVLNSDNGPQYVEVLQPPSSVAPLDAATPSVPSTLSGNSANVQAASVQAPALNQAAAQAAPNVQVAGASQTAPSSSVPSGHQPVTYVRVRLSPFQVAMNWVSRIFRRRPLIG